MTAEDSFPLRPPTVIFTRRHFPSDELAGIAHAWLEISITRCPA